jgi:hypothetical protein
MTEITGAKSWDINHSKGFFKIHIFRLGEEPYVGLVLYYEPREDVKEGDDREQVDLKVKSFVESSEKQSYTKCIQWIDKNLGSGYKTNPES